MIPTIILPYISPDLISIELYGLNLAIRWYALSYIIGFLIGWRWFIIFMKKPALWSNGKPPLTPEQPEQLLTWIIIGVIIGGRLGYVVFYRLGFFLENPLEIFKVWTGGMSFHGAFVGLIIATILYCKRTNSPLGSVSDTISITVTPGLFLGRVANFINMELYGRPTDISWGVVYPGGPAAICPDTWLGVCSRHPSQLYEALLEGLLLCFLLSYLVYRKGFFKIPWRISGLFFLGYGLARIFVEYFREPDPQFISGENPLGFIIQISNWIGFTMGQLLSLPMVIVGLWLIFHTRKGNHASIKK